MTDRYIRTTIVLSFTINRNHPLDSDFTGLTAADLSNFKKNRIFIVWSEN